MEVDEDGVGYSSVEGRTIMLGPSGLAQGMIHVCIPSVDMDQPLTKDHNIINIPCCIVKRMIKFYLKTRSLEINCVCTNVCIRTCTCV